MKNILCLWSGGIDSTCMVLEYLRKGYHVDCCYVKLHNNVVKTRMELQAIDFIYNDLQKIFERKITKNQNTFDIDLHYTGDTKLKQFPIWLNCLINAIHINHDMVAMGYIMNDDAISYLEEFKKVYYSYSFLFDNNIPEIEFPLSKVKKREIFSAVPIEIAKKTVFCETPFEEEGEIYKPCGSCETCEKRRYYEKRGYIPNDLIVFGERWIEKGDVVELIKKES